MSGVNTKANESEGRMTTNIEKEICPCCDADDYLQPCTCLCQCRDCCEEGREIADEKRRNYDNRVNKANHEKLLRARATVDGLMRKVQILVDTLDEKGKLEDNMFIFPDGEIWYSKYQS